MVAGTPPYMSPEQVTGGWVDARSDVFAFGSLLYEMVTGRRAFSGSSVFAILAAVVREQPKAPSELVSDLPRDLEKLIVRCLRKEPERRFQHMGDSALEIDSRSGVPGPTDRTPFSSHVAPDRFRALLVGRLMDSRLHSILWLRMATGTSGRLTPKEALFAG